jgi:hypothetical protein
VKNITPPHMRCTFGGCPAVYTYGKDELIIVGRIRSLEWLKANGIEPGPDEEAVIISRQMVEEALAAHPALPVPIRLP